MIWVVQSCLEKYFASGIPQISGFIRPVPFPRGAYRDRHERGAELRWTWQHQAQFFARTNDVAADGEVVWFWRSDAGAKVVKTLPASCGRRWQPSMVTGKSTKETVKTIVQGMPADAVYLWLLTRVLFAAHAASGATRIRHSLRPRLFDGPHLPNTSGASVPRDY